MPIITEVGGPNQPRINVELDVSSVIFAFMYNVLQMI